MSLLEKASLIITPNAVKESVLYSVVPNTTLGDMNVVRATTATRVNSSGLISSVGVNIPRLDYTNGSCPSLLVEPQRTNTLTYSNAFSNGVWGKINSSITSNYGISPDGAQNASLIQDTIGNSTQYRIYQSLSGGNNQFTISLYVKRLNGTKNAYIDLGPYTAYFNFTTETIYSATGIVSFTKLPNDWYRINLSSPASYNLTSVFIGFASGNSETYTSDGTNQMLFYGAQLEQGSYATSYIPTVASTVTRNADVISKTGISSLIGQTEGTLFLEYFNKNGLGNIPFRVIGSDGKIIWIRGTGAMFFGNSSALLFNNYGTPTANQTYKIAFVYGQNDFRLYVNGSLISSVTSGTFTGSFNDIQFPALPNETPFGDQFFVNSLQLYKTKLSNTELAQLTTL